MDITTLYCQDLKDIDKRIDNSIKDCDLTQLSDTPKNREIIFVKSTQLVHHITDKVDRMNNHKHKHIISRNDAIQSGNYGMLCAIDSWFENHTENKERFDSFYKFAYMRVYKHIMLLYTNNSRTLSHGERDYGIRDINIESVDVPKTNNDNESMNNLGSVIDLYHTHEDDSDDIHMSKDIIENVMSLLCDKDRDILLSYYKVSDIDIDDISEKYEMSKNYIKTYVSRILSRLRKNISSSVISDCNELTDGYRTLEYAFNDF